MSSRAHFLQALADLEKLNADDTEYTQEDIDKAKEIVTRVLAVKESKKWKRFKLAQKMIARMIQETKQILHEPGFCDN